MAGLSATETPLDAEFRVRHADGGWRWTHARAVPLRDDFGKLRGWVGMNTDVTERKATEAAQREAEAGLREANRRKDEFLALLGHELRNPLAPLRSGLIILDRKLPADSELRRIRDVCERQVLHLTHIVDELLDVARISSGRLQLKTERVDFCKVIEAAVLSFEFAVRDLGHEVALEKCSEPLEVEADEVRLTQIVINLLDNAVKYAHEKGPIRVSVRKDGGDAVLSVADNGVGLSPEALAHILDVFNQGGASFQDRNGGLGLGLTLVRRLAELHGGSAEARSGGPRARAPIWLPLATPSKTIGREAVSYSPPAPRRILVVEDNALVAGTLKQLLEMDGHQVTVAPDGEAALKMAAADVPEVVLLDIGLSDIDGYEVVRRLRERPPTSRTLVIATSGFGQPSDRDRSMALGIDHHS